MLTEGIDKVVLTNDYESEFWLRASQISLDVVRDNTDVDINRLKQSLRGWLGLGLRPDRLNIKNQTAILKKYKYKNSKKVSHLIIEK